MMIGIQWQQSRRYVKDFGGSWIFILRKRFIDFGDNWRDAASVHILWTYVSNTLP